MSRLFINANNTHLGGGKILLEGLIKTKAFKGERVLILDSRMQLTTHLSSTDIIKRVLPSALQRFLAELWLVRNVKEADTVLCFGNLPPLFKLPGHVVVFVQNRYLLENVSLDSCTRKERFRLRIERLWIRFKLANVNQFIVQTPSMKDMLVSILQGKTNKYGNKSKHEKYSQLVKVLPLMDSVNDYQRQFSNTPQRNTNDFDFIYVASGTPYKNHRRLIEAWCLLAEEDIFPSLCLTIDENHFPELTNWIEEMTDQHKLKIQNSGVLSHNDIIQLYGRADALIYPSLFESFGIPLIEARQAGLAVLASELDYVRDVLDPEESFNPESVLSIVGAIKRFIGVDELPLPLQDAEQFIHHISAKNK